MHLPASIKYSFESNVQSSTTPSDVIPPDVAEIPAEQDFHDEFIDEIGRELAELAEIARSPASWSSNPVSWTPEQAVLAGATLATIVSFALFLGVFRRIFGKHRFFPKATPLWQERINRTESQSPRTKSTRVRTGRTTPNGWICDQPDFERQRITRIEHQPAS